MLNVPTYCTHYFMIFKWSEFIEIIAFIGSFYYLAKWLHHDKTKKLFHFFILFWSVFLLSDLVALATLHNFLLYFSPFFLMLFILAHQHTIQKNFVTIKDIKPAQIDDPTWIQDIIKTCIIGFSHHKDLRFIIETEDKLDQFITIGVPIECFISKDLLHMLIMSPLFQESTIIFIQKNGILKGVHSTIKNDAYALASTEEEQEKSLILSLKSDALYLKSSSTTRTFDIAVQGKVLNNINSAQALSIIETYYRKNKKKDVNYATNTKNTSYKQFNH